MDELKRQIRLDGNPRSNVRINTASLKRSWFTTYQRDQESGLDYAMNRYASNTRGRFTSVDKGKVQLFVPLTLNGYLYAAADPINYTDPDGNFISTVTPPPPPPIQFPVGVLIAFIGEGSMNPVNIALAGIGTEPEPEPQRDWCDRSNSANARVRNFIATFTGAAETIHQQTGVNVDFILAWAAVESGYGLDPVPTLNNNFFGLKRTDRDPTGGWFGAIACSSLAGEHDSIHTCFNVNSAVEGFQISGAAALTSQNGRYGNVALAAQYANPGNFSAIAAAIATAGYNPNPQKYGQDISEVAGDIDRRKNCP